MAYKLAIVDGTGYVSKVDIAVRRFTNLLNQLDNKFPKNKQQIANMTVYIQKEMAEKGVRESLLNIMVDMNKFPSTPELRGMKYAEYIAMYAVLREGGVYE